MIFKDLLQEIVEGVDGAEAATLMGFDGIQVADYFKQNTERDIQTMAVEFSKLLKDADLLSKTIFSSEIKELSLSTDVGRLIFHPVTPEYFVVVFLQPHGNFGKARYLLGRCRPKILQEL